MTHPITDRARELVDLLDYLEWLHVDGRPNPIALAYVADFEAESYVRGFADAKAEALECQPCTAENPNEDAYQRARFDGIMEFASAIEKMEMPNG